MTTAGASGDGGQGAEVPDPPAVVLRGITKRFGPVLACDSVDLTLRRGRVHGVLGENGAGKSTLMNVLIGLVTPDRGTLEIHGVPVRLRDPVDAAAHGIGMVHQHDSLVDALTVWENVALGDRGRLDPATVRARVVELGERYGLEVDPDARVADLPAGLRQRVEILSCLRRDPSILLFDEPTSALTPEESEQLFRALRRVVREEGRAVALVSHRLDEILRATDEVTVMRQGAVVERLATAEADADRLAVAMVGRTIPRRAERPGAPGFVAVPPVLAVRDAVIRRPDGRRALDGCTLEVRPGEIVGVAGVAGNGQRALADLLSSLERLDAGSVEVDGVVVPTGDAGAMAAAGVAVIPEDRHDSGIVLDMTVAENLVLVDVAAVSTRGVLSRGRIRDRALELIDRFGIVCSGPDAPLWSLSGGNQQRVVLARELSHGPRVLVAAQPSRGLDIGAIDDVTSRIREVAAAGVGVLLISSDLDEILELSDRIVVLLRGRIIGELSRREADRDRLGRLLGGEAGPVGEGTG
ncbi:MAG: ABC transporter ATP-binding protein [Acidimicrobiales bacterium]|nr:ABC transporter ATP-binding protein [Acidimicrobiales bacterium]